MATTNLTASEALRLLARAQMRPFDKADWDAFAGCETREPMIGECDGYVVVLDGNELNVIADGDDYGGLLFELRGT